MLKLCLMTFALMVVIEGEENFLGKLKNMNISFNDTTYNKLPKPEEVVFYLTEEEYADYHDFWTSVQKTMETTNCSQSNATICNVNIDDLPVDRQPVYISGGKLLTPTGSFGNLQFSSCQPVTAVCYGSTNGVYNPYTNFAPQSATLVCQSGSLFRSPDFNNVSIAMKHITCRDKTSISEVRLGTGCSGRNVSISVGLQVLDNRYEIFTSCFQESNYEVLYVTYKQTPANSVFQLHVARPKLFEQGPWFSNVSDVNSLYNFTIQRSNMAYIVGNASANSYINSSFFLARGHLAAKTDFVLATSQQATFTFVNCVPQWQTFNGGNWNTLERDLRKRIGETGYWTTIYTGTWGILKLRDHSNVSREIYLDPINKKIPVPQWIYKVVYDPSSGKGIVFLGLNNVHATLAEAKNMSFCLDKCLRNSTFTWLTWQQENVKLGYSICCDVNDFKNTVKNLPWFTVNGLLTFNETQEYPLIEPTKPTPSTQPTKPNKPNSAPANYLVSFPFIFVCFFFLKFIDLEN